MRDFIPKMSGAWSIWLASALMGLKHFTLEGFAASILVLASVQSFLKSKKDIVDVLLPALLSVLIVYGIFKNGLLAVLIFPYLILLLLLLIRQIPKIQRVYIKLGAIILTLPFPLMAGFYGMDQADIIAPWFLLILTTLFNVLLADSLIFEKSVTLKNYLILGILILSFYFLSPFPMFLIITTFALALIFLGEKISVKQLGFSLLAFHLVFSGNYLLFFS